MVDALIPSLAHAAAHAALAREENERRYPLAYALLWDRAEPRTSQKRTAQRLVGSGVLMGFAMGGNRTGKSELGAMLDIIYALGRDHVISRMWAACNGIDISHVPLGPGVVWNAAPTFADSKRYVRPKLNRWAPEGSAWRGYDNPNGEAELLLPEGGRVVCKAVKQGRDGFQGDAVRMIRFDEEPTSKPVVDEALMRIADERGRILFTMTPLLGWTPLLLEYVEAPDDDTVVCHLHGKDNPHVDPEFLEKIYRKNESQRAARERGEIVVMEGLVYGDYFRHAVHVVDAFEIPPEWPRYRVIDFGIRNPCAILWIAVDPDDRAYVYREHYQAGWIIRQHAEHVYQVESCGTCNGSERLYRLRRQKYGPGEWTEENEQEQRDVQAEIEECETCSGSGRCEPEPEYTLADPAGKEERTTLDNDHWIHTRGASKEIQAGIDAVIERLQPQPDGMPALYFFRHLKFTLREMGSYRYADTSSKSDPNEKPVKKDDHAMDGLRYFCKDQQRADFEFYAG